MEQDRLIVELREALAKVKRLSCMHVEFTHGICPECAAKLYPE